MVHTVIPNLFFGRHRHRHVGRGRDHQQTQLAARRQLHQGRTSLKNK